MSTELFNVADIFGENVFNDTVMQERLPKKVYKNLRKTIEEGKDLDLETADVIAHEMKEWAIVDFLRKSSRPGYTQEMVDQITAVAKTAGGPSEETDEFFEQAVDLILEKEKASVSMLQRQFRIGYNRAARLMDELERRGMVGPEEGSKPRKVLITRAQWEEMQSPTEENP